MHIQHTRTSKAIHNASNLVDYLHYHRVGMEVTFCDVLLSGLPPNFLGIKDRNKQFMKCYICMSGMSISLITSLSGIRLK